MAVRRANFVVRFLLNRFIFEDPFGESVYEAAASALNALDARALVNGVRVLGQTGQMSRI
jgi:hypothetical protein